MLASHCLDVGQVLAALRVRTGLQFRNLALQRFCIQQPQLYNFPMKCRVLWMHRATVVCRQPFHHLFWNAPPRIPHRSRLPMGRRNHPLGALLF